MKQEQHNNQETTTVVFKQGFKFYSKHFNGLVEVLEEREDKNQLEVKITLPHGTTWHEEWNLQHTIWGFKSGDYFTKIDATPTQEQGKSMPHKIGDGRIVWEGETYVNEKSGRVLTARQFDEQSKANASQRNESFTLVQDEEALTFNGNESNCRADYEASKEPEETETFFDWCKNSYPYTQVNVAQRNKRGNPIAEMRFRWQTWTKDTDEPLESEWSQLKKDAMWHAAKYLVRQFEKFQKDDMVVKVFNEMNHKQKPTIITLDDARRILNNQT